MLQGRRGNGLLLLEQRLLDCVLRLEFDVVILFITAVSRTLYCICRLIIRLFFVFKDSLRAKFLINFQITPVDKLQNLLLRVRVVRLGLQRWKDIWVRPPKSL